MTSTEIPTDAEIDAALTDETPEVDPAAPYGRKADGTPKRGPGGRPSGKAGRRPGARPGGNTRPRSTGPTAPAPKRSTTPRPKPSGKRDYREGITGLLHLISLPLTFASPLDSAALMLNADELADAINETAQERAEVAALCERLLQVGPYGLIIGVGLKIGAQVAENHAWLPTAVTTKLGAVPRDQLAAHLGMKVQEAEAARENSGD